ncbi:serine/threonine-protein kinase [Nonomuraea sp. NPDC059007]|uniref:serine/threonine-protein kinase n=1 Tax=Nonomuraea sp. NPDC059007 TaxID=3346692 RepID=UPI00367F317F
MKPLEQSDPTRIGDILLKGRLGSGGMGRVFYGVAQDSEPVAVKLIREELINRTEIRARFAREIDALRTVQSLAVAGLVDASEEDDDTPWVAVEYVRGMSLGEFVKSHGPLPIAQAAFLGVLLTDALAAIHLAGLLHRDLKPANILLGRDGPKVIDLGLVAFADGPTDLTTTESMLGTPVCMAPEQASSPKQISAAADVYALAATLLFATTGHYPYDGPTLPKMFMNIMDANIRPDLAGLPDELQPVITAMLAHDPAARPTVSQARRWLADLATADGITLPLALRRFAVATFVEQPTDPPEIDLPLPSRPARGQARVRDSVVAQLAEEFRVAYAADARF